MSAISFGTPGSPKKTFADGGFDLVSSPLSKLPCKLAPSALVAPLAIKDGLFVAPSAVSGEEGTFVLAPDAARSTYLVFTANTQVILGNPLSTDPYPGEERTDTVTGLIGPVVGIFPLTRLTIGTVGGAAVALSTYTTGRALTIKDGKLCPANFGTNTGERVVAYVEFPASQIGDNSIQVRTLG